MPVPFRDDDDVDELGSAGFFKLERTVDGDGCLGALFVINARGIPLEFAYNRVTVPHAFLWRSADLRRFTERRLAASLLSVCTHQPRLFLCLADEVDAAVFAEDIRVDVPVGLVSPSLAPPSRVDVLTGEILDQAGGPADVAWLAGPPRADSPGGRLFDALRAHGLVCEPFDRASLGLREAYASLPGPSRR
jgi:hypothetical protein